MKRSEMSILLQAEIRRSQFLIYQLEFKNVFHESKVVIKRINFTAILFCVLGNY